jgi:hypothetical protein
MVMGGIIFYEKKAAFRLALYDFTGLCHIRNHHSSRGEKSGLNGGLQLSVCETLALLFSFLFFLYWVVSFQGWLFVFFFDFAFITTARCCAFSLLLSSLPFCEDKFGFF